MIELSLSKLLLLAVITLVVLGPEKLPKAARMAGAMLRRLRLGWENVRAEVEREFEFEEMKRAAREAAMHAESAQAAAEAAMRNTRVSVQSTVDEVVHAANPDSEKSTGDGSV